MTSLLLDVLPYALAAALAAPIVAVVTAVILSKSQRPIASSWVFVAGAATLDALFAAVILVVFWGQGTSDSSSDIGAYVDIVLGVLFLGLGIMAVFKRESPEKEEAQRARVEKAATAGLPVIFATGIAAQIINSDALAIFGGGLKEILLADPTPAEATVTVVFMLVILLLPYYAPIVVYLASPEKAGQQLTRMSDWLLSRSRLIEIVVGIGFGSMFLWKGIAAL
jgi:threonine/homoserine/homoserine lactone efflux protein